MTGKEGGVEVGAVRPGKYSRVERERRFLLVNPPAPSAVTVTRLINDRYLTGTRLRVRRADSSDGRRELKLTQKVPEAEFTTDEEARSFVVPAECVAEVTDDTRFTGGRLVRASRQELLGWLAEYGLHPEGSYGVFEM
ncbi:hypothetical protein [Streptomyces olivochromogenes]|uniref:hypothetical protein n=1 Tax=Streptomyces olivochromogenes TaxID=1963 RepID=UPI001F2985AE|nr:hypothetical protein [Streptomyces olivochromogenes]MCF3136175.1 hypothetical protein [Streptomyces olivochromogenes]